MYSEAYSHYTIDDIKLFYFLGDRRIWSDKFLYINLKGEIYCANYCVSLVKINYVLDCPLPYTVHLKFLIFCF